MGLVLAAATVAVATTLGLAATQPQVSARIATGKSPCEAASAAGALWVANDRAGTLARVDPRTNRVTLRINLGRGLCASLRGRAVWVANYRTGAPACRPEDRKMRSTWSVVPRSTYSWRTATFGRRDSRMARLSRSTRAPRVSPAVSTIGGAPTGLLALRAIWVGFGRGGDRVARVDPGSGSIQRIESASSPAPLRRHESRHLGGERRRHVRLLDPVDGHVSKVTRSGRTLGQAERRRWTGHSGFPTRRSTRSFDSTRTGGCSTPSLLGRRLPGPGAYGSMWVTSYAGADVWRFRAGPRG